MSKLTYMSGDFRYLRPRDSCVPMLHHLIAILSLAQATLSVAQKAPLVQIEEFFMST